MEARINVITLGVSDILRSRTFYQTLGFTPSSSSNDHFVAFQTPGIVFCLYPLHLLAEDANTTPTGTGFRGVTLSINVAKKEEVKTTLAGAEKCGAKIIKQPQDVFWGGHSGYFADPDGHFWEVAWNPHWQLKANGLIDLQK